MRTDADKHQPVSFARLDAVLVLGVGVVGQRQVLRRGVLQLVDGRRLRLLDFFVRAVADEHGLALPEHGYRLPGFDGRQVDFDGRQRARVGVGVHLVDHWPERGGAAHQRPTAGHDGEEVAARVFAVAVAVRARCPGRRRRRVIRQDWPPKFILRRTASALAPPAASQRKPLTHRDMSMLNARRTSMGTVCSATF